MAAVKRVDCVVRLGDDSASQIFTNVSLADKPEPSGRLNANGQWVAQQKVVIVRITKQPTGSMDGVSLKDYLPGQVYDVTPTLADFLVVQGYALMEMRRTQRPKPSRPERRQIKFES